MRARAWSREASARAGDVLWALAQLGQDVHAVGQDFAEAPEARQVQPLPAHAVRDLAQTEGGQEWRVSGADAEVAVFARRDHLVHLLAEEEPHRRHHLQDDLGREGHGYLASVLACSNTSSIGPTRLKASSET